jgi:hypothetical protein
MHVRKMLNKLAIKLFDKSKEEIQNEEKEKK